MRQYEVTFVVDPVLSGDEVKSTAKHIENELTGFGAKIVAVDEIGLRQLTYPINRRSSGIYYCIEFSCETAEWIGKFELNTTRNEKILRYLTVKLDRYGVKYNDDKRNGKFAKRSASAAQSQGSGSVESAPAPVVVDLDAPAN